MSTLSLSPPLMARVAGMIYVFGAFVVAISLALPHPEQANRGAIVALIAVASLGGVTLAATANRATPRLVHAAIALGSALICTAIYLGGAPTGVYATMFVWVVLLSAYFFPGRGAFAQLAWLLALYAVTLAAMTSYGHSSLTRWLVSALALGMASAMTSWLVARARLLERRLARFFGVSLDMFCTSDAAGRFLEVNDAWTRTLGYTREELVSRPYVDFVHPDDRQATLAQAVGLSEGRDSVDFENRYRARDGSWRWLRWAATLDRVDQIVYARATDVTALKAVEAERERLLEDVREQARTDALTGIPNRRWLEDELRRELGRGERRHFPLTVAYLDLDRFKDYNDAHGHAAGDRLLCDAVDTWRAGLRVGDFLARYGGEEFVVVLPDTGLDEARAVVERIRERTPHGQTCSAGVARWEPGMSIDTLIARADLALYEAKRRGRDRVALAPATAARL